VQAESGARNKTNGSRCCSTPSRPVAKPQREAAEQPVNRSCNAGEIFSSPPLGARQQDAVRERPPQAEKGVPPALSAGGTGGGGDAGAESDGRR
jgi:hypothetical protein